MKRVLVIAMVLVGGLLAATMRTTQPNGATARAALDDGVLRAVVLGDSVARGAGDERGGGIPRALDARFRARGLHAAPVANLGINGARTANVSRLLSQSTARAAIRGADVVVLSIGGNDLYGDSRARLLAALVPDRRQHQTLARIERIVAKLHDANPAARIYLLGLYNPYRHSRLGAWLDRQVNQWDARLIARFAEHRNVTVVRICDLLQRDDRISALDHFHPGAAGYASIAERIASSM